MKIILWGFWLDIRKFAPMKIFRFTYATGNIVTCGHVQQGLVWLQGMANLIYSWYRILQNSCNRLKLDQCCCIYCECTLVCDLCVKGMEFQCWQNYQTQLYKRVGSLCLPPCCMWFGYPLQTAYIHNMHAIDCQQSCVKGANPASL